MLRYWRNKGAAQEVVILLRQYSAPTTPTSANLEAKIGWRMNLERRNVVNTLLTWTDILNGQSKLDIDECTDRSGEDCHGLSHIDRDPPPVHSMGQNVQKPLHPRNSRRGETR